MKKIMIQKDYSEQLEFLNGQPYYASKKIVIQSSDFPVRTVTKKALLVFTPSNPSACPRN